MKDLFSIRMRASKILAIRIKKGRPTGACQQPELMGGEPEQRGLVLKEVHISGAEGLHKMANIRKRINEYIQRALTHPKGKPDKIVITIENITEKPRLISSLPVTGVECGSPEEARNIIMTLLMAAGVSDGAAMAGMRIVRRGGMRGASLVDNRTADRLEPDRERGIRVSRLGFDGKASRSIALRLVRGGINTSTVKEAVAVASKVISCRRIIAELCISDDPDYTTGYVASSKFGYVRIPKIKKKGNSAGGRVFFVGDGFHVKETIEYLERVPVIIKEAGRYRGIIPLNEIIHCADQ